MMLSESATHRLLDELCTKLGVCLPPADRLRLRQHPPVDVRAFVDAVFVAEGLDPELVSRHLYRDVHDRVTRAFDRGGGEGCE